jgi:UDP-glucose-4-epimerase GalE
MARLLVTGGAGYVGSHALRALASAGHEAVVLDDLRSGTADAVGGAALVRGDAGDPALLARLFAERGPFAGVLHFAGSISVPESVTDPLLYYRNNAAGSAALLAASLAHGVRAFVFSSTAAVYGTPARQPIDESAPIQPESPYGASKAMVERMLADVERAHGLRWLALRYFNASGADPAGGIGERHDPETHLVPLALEAAAGLRPALSLYGTDWPTPDGTCIRDYVHVSDLADAHRLGIEALLGGGASGCFNLGTGRGHSIREVLAAVERVTGRRVPVEPAPRRPGDPPVLVADASRFRTAFAWSPARSTLDTIVATAWAWLRSWRGL